MSRVSDYPLTDGGVDGADLQSSHIPLPSIVSRPTSANSVSTRRHQLSPSQQQIIKQQQEATQPIETEELIQPNVSVDQEDDDGRIDGDGEDVIAQPVLVPSAVLTEPLLPSATSDYEHINRHTAVSPIPGYIDQTGDETVTGAGSVSSRRRHADRDRGVDEIETPFLARSHPPPHSYQHTIDPAYRQVTELTDEEREELKQLQARQRAAAGGGDNTTSTMDTNEPTQRPPSSAASSSSSSSRPHQRQPSVGEMSIPERRASFVDHGAEPNLPGTSLDTDEHETLLPSAHTDALSDADLIQPIHPRSRSSEEYSPEIGGRQRRKRHPNDSDSSNHPSSDGRDSGENEHVDGDGDDNGVPAEPSRSKSKSKSKSKSRRQSHSRTQSSSSKSHASRAQSAVHEHEEHEDEDDHPLASPSGAVSADVHSPVAVDASGAVDEEDDDVLPVFDRPVRRYRPITDPAAELARIRQSKSFEPEFDDLTLPTFLSSEPDNPLKPRYDEVHSLIDEESARPLPTVDDSSLLHELLGVGKLSLDEVEQLEAELEADRLEDIQKELQRSTRRELELATFQHALLEAYQHTEDVHKKEILEKEHQLLQSTRLMIKEEQESFRRSEDRMREWLLKNKHATLNAQMQDLTESEPGSTTTTTKGQDARDKDGLKDRHASSMLGDPSLTEDEKIESSKQEIHDLYARVRSRKYDIQWNYEPRLIRIRLDWLRCIKNKLPIGNYNIMVTLYDRLGGDALRWSTAGSNLAQSQVGPGKASTCFSHTGSTTIPQRHGGKFHNLELTFNQRANRIFLACPPMLLSRPSMVFIFELFLMGDDAKSHSSIQSNRSTSIASLASGVASKAQELLLKARDPKQYALLKAAQQKAAKQMLERAPPSSDRVVAWGAFPMAYINFDIIKGQFKVPLLRGAYGNEPIEKFETIHEKISSNLDHWLANLYFDVRHWPRLLDHGVENSVELNFKGKKLTGADDDGNESSDEEEEEEMNELIDEDGVLIEKSAHRLRGRTSSAGGGHGPHGSSVDFDGLDVDQLEADVLILDDGLGITSSSQQNGGLLNDGPPSAPHNSQRAGRGDHAIDLSLAADSKRYKKKGDAVGPTTKSKKSSAPAKHEATTSTERRMKIKLHTRKFPGMLVDIPDTDTPSSTNPSATAFAADLRNPKKRAEMCAKYRYNVNLTSENGTDEEGTASQANGPLGRRAAYKMKYIANEIWNDLGIKRLRDWEFFFFLIFASLWVRIYTHYLGQHLFLSSIYVPITKFECKWYTCDIFYVWDPLSVTAQTQIGVVVIGVLTNMIILFLMIAAVRMIQLVLGRTPSWTSRMLLAWGCGTIVEPFLILVIDMAQHNWYGDSFKLYQYYLAKDGNGTAGIFMTILLTMLLVTCSIVEFYFYIIKIHMNGRILDVHYRLHGGADLFHIPHDLEISVRELRWILIKAHRWIGMGGQKRKVQVSKFRVRDPLRSASKQDITIYIAIYTQSLNGDIELFRHFIRNPSGSIVEIFDAFDIPGEDQFKRIEEKLTAHEKRLQSIHTMSTSLSVDFSAKLQHTHPNRLTTFNKLNAMNAPGTPSSNALAGKSERLKAMLQRANFPKV